MILSIFINVLLVAGLLLGALVFALGMFSLVDYYYRVRPERSKEDRKKNYIFSGVIIAIGLILLLGCAKLF